MLPGSAPNVLGRPPELLDLASGKAFVLDVAEEAQRFGLFVQVIHNIRVSGGRQAEQDVRIRGQDPGEIFDDFRARRPFHATFDTAQIRRGNAHLARCFAEAELLRDTKLAQGLTEAIHAART